MIRRLMTLILLLVHVDFTKSGGNPNLWVTAVVREEREGRRESKIEEDTDRWRQQLAMKDLEIIKLKQKLRSTERDSAVWKSAAQICIAILERDKRLEQSLDEQHLRSWEGQIREGIANYETYFRILILSEEVSEQRIVIQNQEETIETLEADIENLEKQLKHGQHVISAPDNPVYQQDGPLCVNFATATWIRSTLTERFLRTLPAHDVIVRNIGDTTGQGFDFQLECIKKEATLWNLDVVEVDICKSGGFDRAHQYLQGGHALLWSLKPEEWGPIEGHIKSSSEYLGQKEWDTRKHLVAERGHSMVITEYIEPEGSKPGLYRIKNSYGKYGGSHGQKGYIMIEGKVLRKINMRRVFVAIPRNITFETLEEEEHEACRLKDIVELRDKTFRSFEAKERRSDRKQRVNDEILFRLAIEKEEMETRIQMLTQELTKNKSSRKIQASRCK